MSHTTMQIDGGRTASFRDEQGNAVDEIYLLDSQFTRVVVRRLDDNRIVLAAERGDGDTVSFPMTLEQKMYQGVTPTDAERRAIPDDLQDALHYVGFTPSPDLSFSDGGGGDG